MKKLLLIPILLTVSQVLSIGLGYSFLLPGAMVVTDASMQGENQYSVTSPSFNGLIETTHLKETYQQLLKELVIKNKYTQHRIEDYSVLTKVDPEDKRFSFVQVYSPHKFRKSFPEIRVSSRQLKKVVEKIKELLEKYEDKEGLKLIQYSEHDDEEDKLFLHQEDLLDGVEIPLDMRVETEFDLFDGDLDDGDSDDGDNFSTLFEKLDEK